MCRILKDWTPGDNTRKLEHSVTLKPLCRQPLAFRKMIWQRRKHPRKYRAHLSVVEAG